MAIGDVNMEVDQVAQLSRQAEQLVQVVRSQIRQLDGQMQNLWPTWRGVAPTRIRPLVDAWQVQRTQMNQGLDAMSQNLFGNQTTYRVTDENS